MKRGANHSVNNVDRTFEHSIKPQIYFKMNIVVYLVRFYRFNPSTFLILTKPSVLINKVVTSLCRRDLCAGYQVQPKNLNFHCNSRP